MMNENKKAPNKNFMLLMLGRIVSDTGTGVQAVVMPLYIIDIGGSAATVGLFTFLALIPALVIYPFAGVFGDRLNRKSIMIGADLWSCLKQSDHTLDDVYYYNFDDDDYN